MVILEARVPWPAPWPPPNYMDHEDVGLQQDGGQWSGTRALLDIEIMHGSFNSARVSPTLIWSGSCGATSS
jgi:hypothetical protein